MTTLFSEPHGRYSVVDNGCPGLKLYDATMQIIAFGNAGYYDDHPSSGKGRTALEIATEDCRRLNAEWWERVAVANRRIRETSRGVAG